jgi:hypothetical protein
MTENPARRDLFAGAAMALLANPVTRALDSNALAIADAASPAALRDRVSILDFISPAEHGAIRARNSTADLAQSFNAAIDHIQSTGGGELYIPAGTYRCGSTIALCKDLKMVGAGRGASVIRFTHSGRGVPDGSGLRMVSPSNGSNSVNLLIADLYIDMTSATNRGACFYDNCGTYVTLRNCVFAGGRFGVVLDQTEVSGIYTCHFAAQLTGGAGLWLVNGPDVTRGNQGGFTNQITVDHNCQFNQTRAHAVIDDGGDCHYFGSNNVNGGGLKFAGCNTLNILGGEYESVTGRPTISFGAHTHYSGNAAGACSAFLQGGIITQPNGQPCIRIESMTSLSVVGMQLRANDVDAHITGLNNLNAFYARLWSLGSSLPLNDTYAQAIHDDGYSVIRTTAATTYTLGGPEFFNALLRTTSGSAVAITVPGNAAYPFPIGTVIRLEQGGAGPIAVAPGGGVTLNGTLRTAVQFQILTLVKTGANRWLVTRQS